MGGDGLADEGELAGPGAARANHVRGRAGRVAVQRGGRHDVDREGVGAREPDRVRGVGVDKSDVPEEHRICRGKHRVVNEHPETRDGVRERDFQGLGRGTEGHPASGQHALSFGHLFGQSGMDPVRFVDQVQRRLRAAALEELVGLERGRAEVAGFAVRVLERQPVEREWRAGIGPRDGVLARLRGNRVQHERIGVVGEVAERGAPVHEDGPFAVVEADDVLLAPGADAEDAEARVVRDQRRCHGECGLRMRW
ncbi:hypothetical protein DFJ74DRAFT_661811 [Hyaloraphidium curvatum]|nr:hypothetical protein DFJ74DRAFT_661811 [Hyaloraphidium curvatum]